MFFTFELQPTHFHVLCIDTNLFVPIYDCSCSGIYLAEQIPAAGPGQLFFHE